KVTSTEGFTVSEVLGAGKSEQEHRIHTAANTKARHKHTFFIMASPFIIYLVIFITSSISFFGIFIISYRISFVNINIIF
ncbi:MAG: hypothetical protein WAU80_02575, partial [Ruminococcus bromii]